MRILKVRFKNLNSLTGEWGIDFEHPSFKNESICAITGPTGAGKTTILDAIRLGLYGRTPRLDRVTKSSNEVMSRQFGECFAEVTFETQKGRFRSHWSQHRAHRRPDGELQSARHEIVDAHTGTVLESKLSNVDKYIEEVTGMDFERFTRSMLLAQGSFAAFLNAPADERAPILEQITGTEIYSQISIKVHERKTQENKTLDTMKILLEGMQVLSPEEETEIRTSLKENKIKEKEAVAKLEASRKALAWLEGISVLEKEITVLENEWQTFIKLKSDFAPQMARLDKAQKALTVDVDFNKVLSLRDQQKKDAAELEKANAELPVKTAELDKALKVKDEADKSLKSIQENQKNELETIKKVRELDTKIGSAEGQINASSESIKSDQKQQTEIAKLIKGVEGKLLAVETTLKNAQAYLADHAADAALVENISAIEKTFNALTEKEKALLDIKAALESAKKVIAEAESGSQKLQAVNEKNTRAFNEAREELEKLAGEIAALLKGQEISQWRLKSDALAQRELKLNQAKEGLDRIDAAVIKVNGLNKSRQEYEAALAGFVQAVKDCEAEKVSSETDVETLEVQVSLLNRIRSLEEERKRLVDGRECPLCGSTEHPYAKGNVPAPDATDAKLKKIKKQLKTLTDKLSSLNIKKTGAEKDIGNTVRDINETNEALKKDKAACTEILSSLGIKARESEWRSKVTGELDAVKKLKAETSAVIDSAEKIVSQEKEKHKALEKLRKASDESGKALQEAGHKKDSALKDHERLIKECEGHDAGLLKLRAGALKEVSGFGVTEIPSVGHESLLNGLKLRRDKWLENDNLKKSLEKDADSLKADKEKQTALLEKINSDINQKTTKHEGLLNEAADLSGKRKALYGDKNTDAEEKRIEDEVQKAVNALDKARSDQAEKEKGVGILKDRINSLNDSVRGRAKDLEKSELKLAQIIKKTGFADEADYRASCLELKVFEGLKAQAESLKDKETSLNALRRSKSEGLTKERAKNITAELPETVKQEVTSYDETLRGLLDLVAISNQKLADNDKLRSEQQGRLAEIEAQKKECTRWDMLHDLIGSADGKKFRNFAQGLTFEMMAAHANRQLEKMTDRYLLVRDENQPLELNVIDNYQACEVRSTKNLSGGESFIVSLALALGLSHMASRNVRVDSLFLDEGFGTLDEDALETALETLAGLQEENKLIGVISHVQALKERIGTQIQVTPTSGGHSIISGPGCSRV